MSSRIKQTAVNIGVLIVSILLMYLACEVFLRVTRIQLMNVKQPMIYQPSSIDGIVYELKPNINDVLGYGWERISTNSAGFRSEEMDPAKPLIAVIGDSYTFGHGVNNDETNPAYLQKEMPEYHVLNAGVDGYNIEQEARTMEARIAPLDPEVVIVEFVFNDMIPKGYIEDGIINVGVGTKEEQEEKLAQAVTQKGLINFPGKVFLEKHSAVFNFVERTTKWLPFRKKTIDTRDTITETDLAFYAQWFTRLDTAVKTDDKFFLIWPESNTHEESRAFLKNLATAHGYTVIDLYDTLGNGYKHLGWDYHPHASVHEVVAKTIAEAIRLHSLLP